MPTNEERRANAKRKLEQQLERRTQQERRRRILTIAGSVAAVVIVAVAVTVALVWTNQDSTDTATASAATTTEEASTSGLPSFSPPDNLGVDCQYPPSVAAASKPVEPPRTGTVPTEPATISASMATDQGNIGLILDNAKAPCTVNSFASLAQQGYFDGTQCHRLTTSPNLSVLQCGDPAGNGSGGPGYQFANEYPTNQYEPGDAALSRPVTYPRGTLAMANAGPNTNGSQFFLVYADSQLPPGYTVFGTFDETGLSTVEKIAAGGVAGGGDDGAPATKVTIKSVLLD